MTKYQKNLATILPRIMKLVEEDEDFAEYLVDCLEVDLDEWDEAISVIKSGHFITKFNNKEK